MESLQFAPVHAGNGLLVGQKGAFLAEKPVTRAELCAELRISYRAFSRMRAEGSGPPGTWLGGRLVFYPEEVRRWLKAYTEISGRPGIVVGPLGGE